jgi:pimeloyl-ACP methyl ester carboxylesterase
VYLAWTDSGLEDTETGVRLSCSPTAEAAVFSTTGGSRAHELLGEVTRPTWIVRATGDRGMASTCPPSAAVALSDCVDFVVEGSGHFLPLEWPDLVVATLRHALLLRSSNESATSIAGTAGR